MTPHLLWWGGHAPPDLKRSEVRARGENEERAVKKVSEANKVERQPDVKRIYYLQLKNNNELVSYIIIIIFINIYCNENAVNKGPHPLYRTEAVLDGSQLSNDIRFLRRYVYFNWPNALHGTNS